ncbi:MAG: NAD(P)-dependent oxidoreductase [Candidatus Micrarchaeota archaeon]
MAKIAFFELGNWEKEYFKKKLKKHKLIFSRGPINAANYRKAKDAQIVSVFIYSQIAKKELDKWKKCKLIATRSTGFDHIDLQECKKRGIKVCNVPEYGSETVAEHTIALIMGLSKKLVKSVLNTRAGNFELAGLRTFDLEGKTLGIIGFGKIGRHVSKMANSFGMKVIAYDPFTNAKEMKKWGAKKVNSMDTLLRKSKIVSLHCPLNEKTRHMINDKTISKMQNESYLINTARGSLVDTKALLRALDKGKIAGAGIDVLEDECAIKEESQLLSPDFKKACDLKAVIATHMLLLRRNVIVTPHNAFNSQEALQRILDTTLMNIERFLRGKSTNLVKK